MEQKQIRGRSPVEMLTLKKYDQFVTRETHADIEIWKILALNEEFLPIF